MVKKLLKLIFTFLIIFFSVSQYFNFSISWSADFPQPTGFVNDFAGMLSDDFKTSLEKNLADFEKETTAEIAVVTVETLGDDYLESYAVALFEQWGIGKKDEDNGLLILIAEKERKIRIEVGYGLEPIITDARAGRIIRNQMEPNFKQGDYDQGVKTAVTQIENYIRSGDSPARAEEITESVGNHLPWIIFGIIIFIYLASYWSRSKRIWPGGLVGGFFGGVLGWITGGLIRLVLFSFGLGLLGLFLDWLLSRNYKKRKKIGKSTSFWSSGGGFFSGGRSGGSSGGGFGGFGGGSSGGGGASGGW